MIPKRKTKEKKEAKDEQNTTPKNINQEYKEMTITSISYQNPKDSAFSQLQAQIEDERKRTKLKANSRNTVTENMDPSNSSPKKIIQRKSAKNQQQIPEPNHNPSKPQNITEHSQSTHLTKNEEETKETKDQSPSKTSEGVGCDFEEKTYQPTAFTYFDRLTTRSIFEDPLQDFH